MLKENLTLKNILVVFVKLFALRNKVEFVNKNMFEKINEKNI